MTRRFRHLRRSAFAAVMAIVLMGLVASTLAAMGTMFAADARRSRAAAAEAQLRQLLIAGAADVHQRIAAGQTSFDLTLEIAPDFRMHLTATTAQPDQVRASVVATLGPRRSEQMLRFIRDAGNWRVVSVDLGSADAAAGSGPSDGAISE